MVSNNTMNGNHSRRQYLKGALGGGALYGLVGEVSAQAEGNVRIPFLKSGDEVVKTIEVPKRWLDHVDKVEKARERVGQRLSNYTEESGESNADDSMESVTMVSIEKGNSNIGGMQGLQVRVRVSDQSEYEVIPNEVDGVNVRVGEKNDSGLSSCPNRGYYDPVPGGIRAWGPGGLKPGSTTTEVLKEGNSRMMTAAHLFGSCSAQLGDSVYINNDSNYIGEVTLYDHGRDIVLIDKSGGEDYENTIREGSSGTISVGGYVTEQGVTALIVGGRDVYQVGSTTGKTSGQVLDYKLGAADTSSNCVDFGGEGVEGDYTNAEGDSGGPVYLIEDGTAYIVNVYQWWYTNKGNHSCGTGNAVIGETGAGTAAYEINRYWGIQFET